MSGPPPVQRTHVHTNKTKNKQTNNQRTNVLRRTLLAVGNAREAPKSTTPNAFGSPSHGIPIHTQHTATRQGHTMLWSTAAARAAVPQHAGTRTFRRAMVPHTPYATASSAIQTHTNPNVLLSPSVAAAHVEMNSENTNNCSARSGGDARAEGKGAR